MSRSLRSFLKAAQCGFILLFVVFCLTTPCNAEKAKQLHNTEYPDIWYQTFKGQEKIFDIFFSDKDIWGNEPVVLLLNPETNRGTAVGFFSGKSKKIFLGDRRKACKPVLNYYFYYENTQRELSRRYILPQKDCDTATTTPDGGQIEYKEIKPLSVEEAFTSELFTDDLLKIHTEINKIPVYGSPVENSKCEPIASYLEKRDKNKKLVWTKSFIRFYPDKDKAPNWDNDQCEGKILINSQIESRLLLPDGTVLIVVPDAVVRIRHEDGGTKPVPDKNFRVFDTSIVLKAKLEFNYEQTSALEKCLSLSGYELMSCVLCIKNNAELEDIQRNLGERLFSDILK